MFKIFGIYYHVSSGLQVRRRWPILAQTDRVPTPKFPRIPLQSHPHRMEMINNTTVHSLLLILLHNRVRFQTLLALFFTVAVCWCCVCMCVVRDRHMSTMYYTAYPGRSKQSFGYLQRPVTSPSEPFLKCTRRLLFESNGWKSCATSRDTRYAHSIPL